MDSNFWYLTVLAFFICHVSRESRAIFVGRSHLSSLRYWSVPLNHHRTLLISKLDSSIFVLVQKSPLQPDWEARDRNTRRKWVTERKRTRTRSESAKCLSHLRTHRPQFQQFVKWEHSRGCCPTSITRKFFQPWNPSQNTVVRSQLPGRDDRCTYSVLVVPGQLESGELWSAECGMWSFSLRPVAVFRHCSWFCIVMGAISGKRGA